MNRRIVYLSWPATEISGGIKLCFRHVEALVEAGVEACVATENGQHPDWFATSAAVITWDEVKESSDVLVFPENHAGLLRRFASWQCPKIVFCQNAFMCYRGLAGERSYADFGVTGILAEGALVRDYCERRFPELRRWTVGVGIDTERFRPSPQKRVQIAFSPRKRPEEAKFIHDLMRAEWPDLAQYPWIPLVDRTESELAAILHESAVYLALSRFEAVPLSLLEAMASGCVVAGFTGWGGELFANRSNGFWVAEDDTLSAASALSQALRLVLRGGEDHADLVRTAVLDARRYNLGQFKKSVVQLWQSVLKALTDGSQ